MFKLKGAYAPIATPFYNEEIAFPQLKENLDKWAATRLEGLVVGGSNGEIALLDEQEKVELFSFVRKNFPNNRPVVAGTGCESLKATLRLTEKAAAAGVDAALVITPWYYKSAMKDEVLKDYYTELADASPIPLILYNMPRNTGVDMNSGLVSELAKHQNIVGIKDSGGSIVQIGEMIHKSPSDFAVFAGSGNYLYASLVLGATGATMAVANVVPDLCDKIIRLYKAGEGEKAKELQMDILEVNAAVTTKYGIGGLKAALDLLGYYGGPTRKPLRPVGPDAVADISRILKNVGALRN